MISVVMYTLRQLVEEAVADMVIGHGAEIGLELEDCLAVFEEARRRSYLSLSRLEHVELPYEALILWNESVVLSTETVCFRREMITPDSLMTGARQAFGNLSLIKPPYGPYPIELCSFN
jgi:hypothetical protein